MKIRRPKAEVVVCALLGTLAAMPIAHGADQVEVQRGAAKREVHYTAMYGSTRTVSASDVATEIANEFPEISAYGKFRLIGQRGDSGGTYSELRSGVLATANENKVHLEWISSEQHVGGSTAASKTTTDLIVEAMPSAVDHYSISATPLAEQIGHDPIIFFKKRPPLDALDQIKSDLDATLRKIPLEFGFALDGKEEMDSPYPSASVFANFERHLGKPIKEDGTGSDTKSGTFIVADQDSPARSVSIKVYPFHSGSKVQFEFAGTYKLKPDGTSTVDTFQPFVEKLQAIAQEYGRRPEFQKRRGRADGLRPGQTQYL